MNVKGSLLLAIFLFIIGLYGLIESLSFGYWESTALPASVSGVIILLSSIEVGKELLSRRAGVKTAESSVTARKITTTEMGRLGVIAFWVSALILGIYLFGFIITVPIFSFLYLKIHGGRWITAIIFALIMLAFIYGTFERGLNASLFEGVIFGE